MTILLGSYLPSVYWYLNLLHAMYIIKKLPTKTIYHRMGTLLVPDLTVYFLGVLILYYLYTFRLLFPLTL